MIDTSFLNTIILLLIIGGIYFLYRNVSSIDVADLPTEYEDVKTKIKNICEKGATINIPEGSLLNKTVAGTNLKIPMTDANIQFDINCD